MREIIHKAFTGEIDRVFSEKRELREYLNKHERKNLCIDNLTKEIKLIEFKNAVKLDADRIEGLAKDFARSFAKITLNYQEEKRKTDLQKRAERLASEENQFYEDLFASEITEIDKSVEI